MQSNDNRQTHLRSHEGAIIEDVKSGEEFFFMAFRQMQTSQRVKAIVRPHKMSVRLSLYTRHRINTAIPNFNFKLIYVGNIHSIVYIKTFYIL